MPRPQTRAFPPRFTITAEVKIALMGWMRFIQLSKRRGPPQKTGARILNCYGYLHATTQLDDTSAELE